MARTDAWKLPRIERIGGNLVFLFRPTKNKINEKKYWWQNAGDDSLACDSLPVTACVWRIPIGVYESFIGSSLGSPCLHIPKLRRTESWQCDHSSIPCCRELYTGMARRDCIYDGRPIIYNLSQKERAALTPQQALAGQSRSSSRCTAVPGWSYTSAVVSFAFVDWPTRCYRPSHEQNTTSL